MEETIKIILCFLSLAVNAGVLLPARNAYEPSALANKREIMLQHKLGRLCHVFWEWQEMLVYSCLPQLYSSWKLGLIVEELYSNIKPFEKTGFKTNLEIWMAITKLQILHENSGINYRQTRKAVLCFLRLAGNA